MISASPPRSSSDLTPPSSDELAAAIEIVLRSLPPEQREQIKRNLLEDVRPIPTPRGGPVLRLIASTLPRQQQWTAKDIREAIQGQRIAASPKQIYNALGYLCRKGHIRQISYGHYVVEGIGAGIVTSDDLDLEPRIEDD